MINPSLRQGKNQRLDLEGRIRDLNECVDKLDELLEDKQVGEAELRKVHFVSVKSNEHHTSISNVNKPPSRST